MDRDEQQAAAVQQARWLAELAQAIDRAQRLARALESSKQDAAEAAAINQRLEAIRLEVDALRRAGRASVRRPIDPFWTGFTPWNRRRAD
ncbi:hypothetical protein [Sphingomonas sp.]|uniref:hypothetical protein n=1 Tax=Sphingomonas sp. TaxID=28214 RepID=UPI00185C74AF|nr:hypothetical protein [Sphingomonas sp.]MBA3512385.1 hypothetical protein [Sphingomonas sp.]